MIVSTNKSDTMLKRCLGKGKTAIIAIDTMIEQFSLDPTVMNPTRDAYIITNEDVSAKRIKDKFEAALLTKHPAVKVIFINKSSRPIYPNGLQGIDAVLQKPNANDVTQTISAVVSASNISNVVQQGVSAGVDIPDFNPNDIRPDVRDTETYQAPEEIPVEEQNAYGKQGGYFSEQVGEQASQVGIAGYAGASAPGYGESGGWDPTQDPAYNGQQGEDQLYVDPSIIAQAQQEQQQNTEEEMRSSMLMDRIRNSGSVRDVSVVAREIKATSIIKELYQTNATYAGIEEKLKSLNDAIFGIMSDPSIKSLDEKLSKVRALLHDKAFFRSQGDTIVEQRLEEIVDVICTHTASLLQSRLNEIDDAVRRVATGANSENNSPRLAGLNEERANILVELHRLEEDIEEIYKSIDTATIEIATNIGEGIAAATDNDAINAHLRARGENIISDETYYAIKAAMELSADKVPSAFKQMKRSVLTMIGLFSKIIKIDSEIFEASQLYINYLKTNDIESTVVTETLLKKSLRVYVGCERSGRSIIPYLMSKYRSRQNANVLLVDLTGTGKYEDYTISGMPLDDYMMDMPEHECTLVVGKADDSVEFAQRLLTMLLKAADYYRVINVVLAPEQVNLFRTLAADVLSVNYIVDTNNGHLANMKSFIAECGGIENIARRVIINKCNVAPRPILQKLDLLDNMDYSICVIPESDTITNAALRGYDPYSISDVDLIMEEVLKHA